MLTISCLQPIDVNKLIKARPLDNMEFMQWMKFHFESHNGFVDDYDPVQRRMMSKTGDLKVSNMVQPYTQEFRALKRDTGSICQGLSRAHKL